MNKSSNRKKSKKKKEKDFLEKLEAQNSALKKIISSFKNGFKRNSENNGNKNLIFSITCLMALFMFSSVLIYAEEPGSKVIASAGDCYKTSGMTLEWTLGESVTNSEFSGNKSVCQGFHQPGNLTTFISELSLNNLKVYPNPFTSELNLKFSGPEFPQQAVVIDITGKQVAQYSHLSPEIKLRLNKLRSGIYFLKLIGGKETHTISLIKK